MSLLDLKLDKLIDLVHKATKREASLKKALSVCVGIVKKEDLVEELQSVFFKYTYAYLFLFTHLKKTEAQLRRTLLSHSHLLSPKLLSQILFTHGEGRRFLSGKSSSTFDSLKVKDRQYFRSSPYDAVRFLLYKVIYSQDDRQAVHNIYSKLFEQKRYRDIIVSTLVRSVPGASRQEALTPQSILDNLVSTGFAVPVTEDFYLFHVRGSGTHSLDRRELFPPLKDYDVLAFDFLQSLEAAQGDSSAPLLENHINPDPSVDRFNYRPSSKCTVLRACAARVREEDPKREFFSRNAREGEVLTVVGILFKTRSAASFPVRENGKRWAFFSRKPWSTLIRLGEGTDPAPLLLSAHKNVRTTLERFCRKKGRVPKPSLFFTPSEVEGFVPPPAPRDFGARTRRPPVKKRPLVVVAVDGPCNAWASSERGKVVHCVHHSVPFSEALSRFGEVSVEDLVTCAVCGEILLRELTPFPKRQYEELLSVPQSFEGAAEVVERLLQDKFAKALRVVIQPTATPLVVSLLDSNDVSLLVPFVVCGLLLCFGETDLQRFPPPKKLVVPRSLLFPTGGRDPVEHKLGEAPTLLFLLNALVHVVVSYVNVRLNPAEFAAKVASVAGALVTRNPLFRTRLLARRLFFRRNVVPPGASSRGATAGQSRPGPKRDPFSVVSSLLLSYLEPRTSWRWHRSNDKVVRGSWTPLPSAERPEAVDFFVSAAGLVGSEDDLSLKAVLDQHFQVNYEDSFVVVHDLRGNPSTEEVVVPVGRFVAQASDPRFGYADTLSYTDDRGVVSHYDAASHVYLGYTKGGRRVKVPPRARLLPQPGFLEVLRLLGTAVRASEDETVFFHSNLVSSLRVVLSRLGRTAFVGLSYGEVESVAVLSRNIANCLWSQRKEGEKKRSAVLEEVVRWAQREFRRAFAADEPLLKLRPPRVVKDDDWVEVQEEKQEEDVDVLTGNNLQVMTNDLDFEPDDDDDAAPGDDDAAPGDDG